IQEIRDDSGISAYRWHPGCFESLCCTTACLRFEGAGWEGIILAAVLDAERLLKLPHLIRCQQRRVVERIACNWKTPSLDCVGKDNRGPLFCICKAQSS